jgi:hypothetical protein
MFQQQRHDPYRGGGGGGGALTRLPEMGELSQTIVRGAQTFTRRHKYITGFYLLGVCVLGLLVLSGGRGRPLDATQVQQYDQIMDSIDVQAEYEAEAAVWKARQRYQNTKGWFWACDNTCQRYKEQLRRADEKLKYIQNESSARVKSAKAVAGVTSDLAVTEIQNSFWSYFTAGKKSAQRQTMWDVVWMVFRSLGQRGREENMAEYIVRILLHLLMNFTVGLFIALVMFIFSLWSIVNSYQPNPMVAVLIFLAASAAGFAFVATYLLAMAGATFGGVYGIAKLAESQQRIGAGPQQQQRPRAHHD